MTVPSVCLVVLDGWGLAPDGSLEGEPLQLDLAPLYSLLREHMEGLNVEGAAVMGEELWLLQRANSKEGANVVVALELSEVLDSLLRNTTDASHPTMRASEAVPRPYASPW